MAISHPKAASNAKKTGANSAKDTLDWRIKELRAFDVSRIQDRWDPVLESLHKSVNEALAEVLGSNSPDYRKFAIETFDATLPVDFGGRYSVEELQRAVQESVAQAIVTLDRVKALVRERSRQQPAASAAPAPAIAAPAAATPSPAASKPAPGPAPVASTPPVTASAPAVVTPPAMAPVAVQPAAPPASPAPVATSTPVPARPAMTSPPPAATAPAPAPIKPVATPATSVPSAPAPVVAPPAAQPVTQAPVTTTSSPAGVRVAILGGESQARRAVLDFVLQLGLQPASAATPPQTELFLDRLDELRDLQYAVVLLPAQSLDPASGAPNAVPPALLMELGHVLATVGRSHVCFLLSGAGKPPAWQGISNLRLDDEGLWHLLLARAMKQSGLDVDLNRAV
ncbi:MAG: hypothetical protein ACOY95_16780 [Pseudomonadota bacterium]